MFIEFSVAGKKSEFISVEFDIGSNDKNLLYYIQNTKKPCLFGEWDKSNKLYYTACNILSVNYKALSLKLFNIYNDLESRYRKNKISDNDLQISICEKVLKTLYGFHPFLLDESISEPIIADLFDLINKSTNIIITDTSFRYTREKTEEEKKIDKAMMSLSFLDNSEKSKGLELDEDYETEIVDDSEYFPPDMCSKIILLQKYAYAIAKGNTDLLKPHIFYIFSNNTVGAVVKVSTKSSIRRDDFESFLETIKGDDESLDINTHSVVEFLAANINHILSKGQIIKKCRICDKLFVPRSRSDEIYCDRTSPYDKAKTCKGFGAVKTYQDNLKTSETMGLYRKVYMQKQMLAKRNPKTTEYREDFELYKTNSKQWKKDVKSGEKTESEYLEWLKSMKKG